MRRPYVCLLLLLMIDIIESQYYGPREKCTSKQISTDTSRCTVIIYCNGVIEYTDETFSYITCFHNYYGYRNYDGSYDLILDFQNMDANEIVYKQTIPRFLSRSKVKKIIMNKIETVSVLSQMLNFDELTHFEIVNSALETIDLSMFINKHNLAFINASSNRISVLENDKHLASSTHTLQLIDLSHNLIQILPNNYFSCFPNLLHLNLSHNYIDHLDLLTFEGLSQLETLYLSYNSLVSIDHSLARFLNLRELMLDHNQITSLKEYNFNVMAQLQTLNLSSNRISEIDDMVFQALHELQILDLSHNNVTMLTNLFDDNTNLETLFLSDNSIKIISKGIFSTMNLTQFRINNNNISGIIYKDTFQGIRQTDFDLSYNKIETLDSNVFSTFGSELNFLNLSHNNIYDLSNSSFTSSEYIATLDVSFNRLVKIEGYFSSLTELKYLNLSNNDLSNIFKDSFKNLISLNILDLSSNAIKTIEDESFNDLRKLKTLILSNTQLTTTFALHTLRGMVSLNTIFLVNIDGTTNYEKYAFSGMTELKIINSSFSGLTKIHHDAFNDTGSIEIIDFSHNLLEDFSINKESVSTIVELYLHNNRIQNITQKMFDGFVSLVKLTLALNHIVIVQDNSLSLLSKLGYLDLSFNELMVINGSQVENMTSLYYLSLKNIKTATNFSSVTAASVKVLDMSLCDIVFVRSLSVYRLGNITTLNLSFNKITFIDKHSFQTMPELSILDLSFNQINYIQPGSFINTNLIKNLNFHNNMISSLQYGVFDGLKNLEVLNLSSNSLSSFEINILHNSNGVSTIVLDDNMLENINLDSYQNKGINELSVGGNMINCDIFIELKKKIDEYSFKITAKTLDYHSENVDGITCKTLSKKNVMIKKHNDTILPNITVAFDSLAGAMDMFRTAIEHVATADVNSNVELKKDIDGVLTTINKLVKLYNDSQLLTNDLLHKMIENSGAQTQQIVKSENMNVKEDVNTPIYITLGCLICLSVLLVILSYSYFKWKSKVLELYNFSSNRHLANDMEME
ncbi:toll-like receptor 6 isoform X2 [Plodia interpunctella]|uniref:toll-like receptor 6 isoform X2 n=1 Tax=Plodia interpunctella TaxID=58824 RepID=UPI0023676970|nr:toll-like receptor 6 isoform X2 [Plodia interpunctella]